MVICMLIIYRMKKSLPVLLLILSCSILFSCGKIQEPEFRSVKNFNIENPGIDSSGVSLDVELFNPNSFGVNLKETVGDFYVDNIYLGRLEQDTGISISANSSFIVRLKGNVLMRELLKNPVAILLQKEVLLRAEGSTKLGKAGFFKTYPFNIQQKQSMDFLR